MATICSLCNSPFEHATSESCADKYIKRHNVVSGDAISVVSLDEFMDFVRSHKGSDLYDKKYKKGMIFVVNDEGNLALVKSAALRVEANIVSIDECLKANKHSGYY